MTKKIVAIIPARGGSKGIPKKNLVTLGGKPLLYYSITACIESKNVIETWVSSDDDQILEYARSLGAKGLRRPPGICKDTSSSESALMHFSDNVSFDTMLFVQATSPLVTSKMIDDAFSIYHSRNDLDSLVTGHIDHGFWWNHGKPLFDPTKRPTRQAQGNLYKESGMFYITSRNCFLSSGCRYSGKSEIYPIDKMSSLEVDTKEDLELIELIMLRRKNNV
jgi:N-acylneuraminate cytidylyltransferase